VRGIFPHPAGAASCRRGDGRRWLRRIRSRHIIEKRSLLAGLEERLRLAAALLGYIDPEDRPRGRGAHGSAHETGNRGRPGGGAGRSR